MIDVVDQDLNGNMEFRSHFSDNSHQDAFTTHAHIVNMFTELRSNNQLNQLMDVENSIVVVLLCFFIYDFY